MLQKLGDHIASAKAMAAAAEERAKQAAAADAKAEHLEMAKAWRHVAASYEFVAQLKHQKNCLGENSRRRGPRLNTPLLL